LLLLLLESFLLVVIVNIFIVIKREFGSKQQIYTP
jgi:hypothetical protein